MNVILSAGVSHSFKENKQKNHYPFGWKIYNFDGKKTKTARQRQNTVSKVNTKICLSLNPKIEHIRDRMSSKINMLIEQLRKVS